jgi:hypothetical protein
MVTRFYCNWRGNKLFRVLKGREEVFCGTADECRRYLDIYHQKECRAREAEDRDPRRRHPTFRIFRIAPRRSRAAV